MSSTDTSERRAAARAIGKLTSIPVRQAQHRGLYGDGGGLFLQVSEGGAKSWIFRFKKDGRLRVMGLGPVHTISLAEARERARECRKLRLDGVDPIEERRGRQVAARLEAAKALTFAECAAAYIEAHRAGWRNAKHAAQWSATLATYVYPVFGALPVQAVDVGARHEGGRADLEHEDRDREPGARPDRERSRLGDGAGVPGRREPGPLARAPREPAADGARRCGGSSITRRSPIVEICAFMAELRQQQGIAARALEFAILTASRTGEVIGARWDEINLAERLMDSARRAHEGRQGAPGAAVRRAMALVAEMAAIRSGPYRVPRRQGRPGAQQHGAADAAAAHGPRET